MFLLTLLMLLSTGGCVQEMANQPRIEVYETSEFFPQGGGKRQPVEGTVPRGGLRIDSHFYTGRVNGNPVIEFPKPITEGMLRRGQERYNIYCTPCHGLAGDGNGMVVQRGFPRPPSYHIDRLRTAPLGHIFDVVTNGIGRMPRFSDRIPPEDRWLIVAYVKTLQFSQHVELSELPETDRAQLEEQE